MNRFLKLLVVSVLAFILVACNSSEMDPLGPDTRILAFGDSLTVGVGTVKENSYPAVLAQLTGLTVINAGVSGETTTGGIERLPQVLSQHDPDLLVLIEGGNDILRNHHPAVSKANLKKMVELAESRDLPVVLIGIPKKALFSDSAPFYQELADEHQLVFDGTLMAGLLRDSSLKSDPIHLNAAGYRKMAEGIYELLKENGMLER